MLILSRRVGESIMIGDDIEIRVVGIDNQARLAIIAPREVTVHRREIWERNRVRERESAKGGGE